MKANLLLQRRLINSSETVKNVIGNLFFNGIWFCYILEDTIRELKDLNYDGDFEDKGEGKVYGETAIPEGTYKIILTMSPRFKKILPLLMDVPGFQGIRIHVGNKEQDSHGCLLPGLTTNSKQVLNSKLAFDELMKRFKSFDEIEITIENKFTKILNKEVQ